MLIVRGRTVNYNSVLIFMASRYVGYGLQFVRGLLVAAYLGPVLFGLWGFVTLTLQYLSYSSLGIQYAINVELATKADQETQTRHKAISTSIALTVLIGLGLFLVGISVHFLQFSLFERNSFGRYSLIVIVIAGLGNMSQLMSNIYRVYGRLARIAASEILAAALPLVVVLFARGEALIWWQLVALMMAGLLSNALLFVAAPFPIGLWFDPHMARSLLRLGIPLLIYNLSFYLITLTGRTVVGAAYSLAMMGYYSFATSITTITLLGVNAIAWVVFPDMLARTRPGVPDADVLVVVEKINALYGTAVFLVVFVMILVLPILFALLPQYRSAASVLELLLLSQAVLALSYGQNCAAIARRRHMSVAAISLVAAAVMAGLSGIVVWRGLGYEWIAVAVLVSSLVFTLLQVQLGSSLFRNVDATQRRYRHTLSLGTVLAIVITALGSLSHDSSVGFALLALIAFIVFDFGKVRFLVEYVYTRRNSVFNRGSVVVD